MITKIVIKGESGYGPVEEAYKDTLTITSDSIAYIFTPHQESEANPARKWRYVTNSPAFRSLWDQLTETISVVLDLDEEPWVTDIVGTTFIITYDDGRKVKKEYWLPSDTFKDTFRFVKKLIPECEAIPMVLMTSEDYNE